MTLTQRWLIALLVSILIHSLILLSFNFTKFSLTSRADPEKTLMHRIVIQDLMTQVDRPSDENYVWSSSDHFEPQQKLPHYLRRIKPSPPVQGQKRGVKSQADSIKNLFEIPDDPLLEALGESDETTLLLNARKYKHYSFFKRVYDKLYPLWISELQARQSFWQNNSEGYYRTRIRIRMNEIGYLTQSDVLLSSQAAWIDSAALDALDRAQPYPNPPDDFLLPVEASQSPAKTYEFIYEFRFELRTPGLQYHLYRAMP